MNATLVLVIVAMAAALCIISVTVIAFIAFLIWMGIKNEIWGLVVVMVVALCFGWGWFFSIVNDRLKDLNQQESVTEAVEQKAEG